MKTHKRNRSGRFATLFGESITVDFLARIGFGEYSARAGGVTHDGKPIPTWDGLGDVVRERWRASAGAIAEALGMESFESESPAQLPLLPDAVERCGDEGIEPACRTHCPACNEGRDCLDAPHPPTCGAEAPPDPHGNRTGPSLFGRVHRSATAPGEE